MQDTCHVGAKSNGVYMHFREHAPFNLAWDKPTCRVGGMIGHVGMRHPKWRMSAKLKDVAISIGKLVVEHFCLVQV